jgi:hypothetical protein
MQCQARRVPDLAMASKMQPTKARREVAQRVTGTPLRRADEAVLRKLAKAPRKPVRRIVR